MSRKMFLDCSEDYFYMKTYSSNSCFKCTLKFKMIRRIKLKFCFILVFGLILCHCYWYYFQPLKPQVDLKKTLENVAQKNRYCQVQKRLGNGTFGTVWQCKTPMYEPFAKEHPTVAVKFMYNWTIHTQKELEILQNLNHK